MAERKGFEPLNGLTRYTISNRAPSARLSHLSMIYIKFLYHRILIRTFLSGGESGIRTHGTITGSLDFESSAFNRTQPSLLKSVKNSFKSLLLSSCKTPLRIST